MKLSVEAWLDMDRVELIAAPTSEQKPPHPPAAFVTIGSRDVNRARKRSSE